MTSFSCNFFTLALAFSISLSLSDGTLDGMPALAKNRYSDMVSSNKIFHLLHSQHARQKLKTAGNELALVLDRPHPLLCGCASRVDGPAGQGILIHIRTYVLNIGGFLIWR